MHYGMKDKNPLGFVKFYSKNRPNSTPYAYYTPEHLFNLDLECLHAQRGDLSLLMPGNFAEILLRVYTKEVRFVHSFPSTRIHC
jgi:deoxynucleoside triphosphate triphosphohydrolase SAMHD1